MMDTKFYPRATGHGGQSFYRRPFIMETLILKPKRGNERIFFKKNIVFAKSTVYRSLEIRLRSKVWNPHLTKVYTFLFHES